MAFKQLSKIEQRTKDAVNGWIRNVEKEIKLEDIPAMINAISFYISENLNAGIRI